ncbi:MAG: HNH nuclease family protein, partial [Gallionella sp.]|nr:HNH nuclease family protein [Gallionella sp.]
MSKPTTPNPARLDQIVAAARQQRDQRELGYRERALKLYPWICGRCGRSFSGVNLRELTVHHKDHNHDNNPSDGSNWELLCLYCHDNEHDRVLEEETRQRESGQQALATHNPFA